MLGSGLVFSVCRSQPLHPKRSWESTRYVFEESCSLKKHSRSPVHEHENYRISKDPMRGIFVCMRGPHQDYRHTIHQPNSKTCKKLLPCSRHMCHRQGRGDETMKTPANFQKFQAYFKLEAKTKVQTDISLSNPASNLM